MTIFYKALLVALLALNIQASHATEPLSPLILRTGFYMDAFSDIDVKSIETALRYWSEELAKKMKIQSETHIYGNVAAMRTDFYQGKIDLIVATPLVLVNEFDQNQLTDGYKTYMHGSVINKLIFVTHKQSGIKKFADVGNKQLFLLKNDPLAQMYVDILALEHFGEQSKQVFAKVGYIFKAQQLILKLFFKQTDVILIYLQDYLLATELNPQIAAQTQIIAELDNIPHGMSFFHVRTDPELMKITIHEAEKMHEYPAGQQLLTLLQATKMERSRLDDLNSTRQLKKRYQQLLKKYSLP